VSSPTNSFDHHFCRVARGNEKGHVESLVGFGRRNFLVPVPSFGSFAELNAHLEAACIADMNRSVRGKPARRSNIVVDADLSPGPTLGNRALLERLVANLLDNAVRYNLIGGSVRVITGTNNDTSYVTVTNAGPLVPESATTVR
jgi:signal transduction histidine kinase